RLTDVVPPDALQCQVEAIGDPRVEAASAVDGRRTVDPVAREQDRAAYRVPEVFGQVVRRDLVDDSPGSPEQPRRDGVTGEVEDAEPGPVHQVGLPFRREGEQFAAGQLLRPEE